MKKTKIKKRKMKYQIFYNNTTYKNHKHTEVSETMHQ